MASLAEPQPPDPRWHHQRPSNASLNIQNSTSFPPLVPSMASSEEPPPATEPPDTAFDQVVFPPLIGSSQQQTHRDPNSKNPSTKPDSTFATKAALKPQPQLVVRQSKHEGQPAVFFKASDFYGTLAKKCSLTLVGKFVGYNRPDIGRITTYLETRLSMRGKVNVRARNKWSVFLNFSCEEAYKSIYFKRTIFFDGYQMRVHRWSPDYKPEEDLPFAPVWISMPDLPYHLHDWEAIRAIMAQVGTPMEIDMATRNRTRPSFAKVRVELDLTKPRVNNVWIGIEGRDNGFLQYLDYEFVPDYCTHCKLIGHSLSECRYAAKNRKTDAPAPTDAGRGQKESEGKQADGQHAGDQSIEQSAGEQTVSEQPVELENGGGQPVGKQSVGNENEDLEEVVPETQQSEEKEQQQHQKQVDEGQNVEEGFEREEEEAKSLAKKKRLAIRPRVRKSCTKIITTLKKNRRKSKENDHTLVLKCSSRSEKRAEKKENKKHSILKAKKKITKNTKRGRTGLLLEYTSGQKEQPKLMKKRKKRRRKEKEEETMPGPNSTGQTLQPPCEECHEDISPPTNSSFCINLEEKKLSFKERLARKMMKKLEEKEWSEEESEDSGEWDSEELDSQEESEEEEIGEEQQWLPNEESDEDGEVRMIGFGIEGNLLGENDDVLKLGSICEVHEGVLEGEEGFRSDGEETTNCLIKAFGASETREESEEDCDEVARQFEKAIRDGSLSPRGINDAYSIPLTRSRARALKMDVRNSPYV